MANRLDEGIRRFEGEIMRTVAAMAALAAVAVLPSCKPAADPKICTPLAAESQIEESKKTKAYDEVLTDCLIVKAREYAADNESASQVAAAVMQACDTYVGFVTSEVYHKAVVDKHGFELAELMSKDEERAIRSAAQRYVVEARSGHCSTDRSGTLVPNYKFDTQG
jgi:hypothetical protein